MARVSLCRAAPPSLGAIRLTGRRKVRNGFAKAIFRRRR